MKRLIEKRLEGASVQDPLFDSCVVGEAKERVLGLSDWAEVVLLN